MNTKNVLFVSPSLARGERRTTLDGRGPAALRTLVEGSEVSNHRSLECPEYDTCLDGAVRSGWRGWTCQHCPFFRLAGWFNNRARRTRAEERSLASLDEFQLQASATLVQNGQ